LNVAECPSATEGLGEVSPLDPPLSLKVLAFLSRLGTMIGEE